MFINLLSKIKKCRNCFDWISGRDWLTLCLFLVIGAKTNRCCWPYYSSVQLDKKSEQLLGTGGIMSSSAAETSSMFYSIILPSTIHNKMLVIFPTSIFLFSKDYCWEWIDFPYVYLFAERYPHFINRLYCFSMSK